MSPEAWAGLVAVLTAVGAIIITIFTWLTARDYGNTVKAMLNPVNATVTQTVAALAQTNTLFNNFMTEHRASAVNLQIEVSNLRQVVTSVDSTLRDLL